MTTHRVMISIHMERLRRQDFLTFLSIFLYVYFKFLLFAFEDKHFLIMVGWGPPCARLLFIWCFVDTFGLFCLKLCFILLFADVWACGSFCLNCKWFWTIQKKILLFTTSSMYLNVVVLRKIWVSVWSIPIIWIVLAIKQTWICTYNEDKWICIINM